MRRTSSGMAMVAGAGVCMLLFVGAFNAGRCDELSKKHFFAGMPKGTPATNDLVIREIYALSSNDETKMADWVAYRLDKQTVFGKYKPGNGYRPDPAIKPSETLEPEDYKGLGTPHNYSRGHQAPRGSFKGTPNWKPVNYVSNLTPQKAPLNNGPWNDLEIRVRKLVGKAGVVYVITGPLYEAKMPLLPKADESHTVPSHYWKIIAVGKADRPETVKVAAFILSQQEKGNANPFKGFTTVDEVEQRSGLDFFHELPDQVEKEIESKRFTTWAREHFSKTRN